MENCQIIAIGMAPKLPINIPVTKPIERSLSNPKWSVSKAGIGETVKLSVQLKKQYENATVEFKVFTEKANAASDKPIQKIYGRNKGGKSEVERKTVWPAMSDDDKKEKDSVKYKFTAESFGCKEVTSGTISVEIEILEIYLKNKVTGDPLPNLKYIAKFSDGTERAGVLDKNGFAKERDIPKGDVKVQFETGEEMFIEGQEK